MTPPRIPYGWHQITEDDIAAVVAVLRDGALTQGERVGQFERELAAYCGAAHAVACNSASSALLLACRAMGLTAGDWLWTSALTFVASASCALHCGAQVKLIDIDPKTGNLSIESLQEQLDQAKRNGQLPRVLIPVHFAGRSCDMDAIGALAREFGFAVIEDAAHALGARELSDPESRIGNCRHSDAVVFSFHPVKLITTGEGGMVMTRNAELAAQIRRLRSHDMRRDFIPGRADWHYRIQEPGYNFRLTELQAALGISQLTRIEQFLSRRRLLARRYWQGLSGSSLRLPPMHGAECCAWHLYGVRCPTSECRQALFTELDRAGIGSQVHYQPLYRLELFADRGLSSEQFPGAEAFYSGALSLPLFPDLTESEQDRIIALIRQALSANSHC